MSDAELAELRQLRARVAALEAQIAFRPCIDEHLMLVLEQVPIVVWTTDRDLRFTSSIGASRALPKRHSEVVGVTMYEYFETEDSAVLPIASSLGALQGEPAHYENEFLGRNFVVHIEPLRGSGGEIIGTIGCALDITDRKMAESRERRLEEQHRDLVENASDLIFTNDLKGNFLTINRAAERLIGYSREEICSVTLLDLVAEESRPAVAQMLGADARRSDSTHEITLLKRNGDRLYVDVSTRVLQHEGEAVAVQCIARDVTERKMFEERVLQSQKMEAIGVLAGGIAHDFNNLLTGILGYGHILKSDFEENSKATEALDVIVRSAERAAELTSQLLGFARRGKNQNVPVDVHATIKEVVLLLERTIDKRIGITMGLNARRSYILGDPTQIYQCLLNLTLNARDAMPKGGELRIRTRSDGETLALSIFDNGHGIPKEIQHRIFEPFFTTKEPNKGTGMGLAMVYGIVTNHGGSVEVESEPGAGTVFHVALPLCEHDAFHSGAPTGRRASTGRGRILVIDDEEVVRRVLARMLEGLGYEVVSWADSRHAVTFYREHWQDVDLVILDMVMPKLGGKECFAALKEINANCRAVLSSGYGRDLATEEILNDGVVGFLQKPYQLAELSQVVRSALGSQARSHTA